MDPRLTGAFLVASISHSESRYLCRLRVVRAMFNFPCTFRPILTVVISATQNNKLKTEIN